MTSKAHCRWTVLRSGGLLITLKTLQWTQLRPRKSMVYGNSTDYCGDQKHKSPLGCGFAIRHEQYKLIKGYGGVPDSYCNKTSSKSYDCFPKTPQPESCPDGFCLYDVIDDPLELKEISAKNKNVVEMMKKQLSEELKNYHQYSLDKSCPPVTYDMDPVVGKAWTPWCG